MRTAVQHARTERTPTTSPHGETVAPLVSIVLLAYNQEATVRRAALTCLEQLGGPYEIVLSDDASTDGTFAVMQAVVAEYRGPHHVVARRNAVNTGIGEHYNELVRVTKGELIVSAAGDDESLPQRVQRLVDAWNATDRNADLIASHVIDMDHDGVSHEVIRVDDLAPYRDIEHWGTERPYIIGAGHAFTRRMMTRFAPMKPTIAYEDQIMVFRAIAMGGAATVDEALVRYRRGGTSARPNVFQSTEHMERWRDRQLARELAEKEQLIADGVEAGCGGQVQALLDRAMRVDHYLLMLRRAPNRAELWAVYRRAHSLPMKWRLKKMLHVMYPNATRHVKRMLNLFHRKRPGDVRPRKTTS